MRAAAGFKSRLSRARRAFRGDSPDRDKAAQYLAEAQTRYRDEIAWRTEASAQLTTGLTEYADAIKHNIGLRVQERLSDEQAKEMAICQSVHRDVSLHF